MASDGALLLLSVATAFAFISAQSTCRNTVNCTCFRTGKRFTICAEQSATAADPCTRWPGCKTCHGGSVGPSSFTGRNPIPRSQQNWQYGSHSKEERRSYSTNPVRPERLSEADHVVTCTDPGQVANADRRNIDGSPSLGVQSYRTRQSVTYTCRAGYALQGRKLITCQTSGSWSNSLPYCRPNRIPETVVPNPTAISEQREPLVFCKDPGPVRNANRVPVDAPNNRGFPEGSSLEYSCNQGYSLQGLESISCLVSGKWSSTVPRCEAQFEEISEQREELIFCKDPGPVVNANRVPVDAPNNRGFPQGSSLEYSCNQGYTLQGVGNIFCLVSGSWSSTVPTCEAQFAAISEQQEKLVFCKDPGPVVNANRVPVDAPNSRGFPQGSSLVYSCNQGYTLQGAGSINCLVSGRWSSTVPRCEEQSGGDGEFCLNPGNIQNGKITYFLNENNQISSEDSLDEPEYPPNSLLVHSCNEGYRLQGAAEMRCLGATGFWSTDPPTCVQG